MGLDDRLKKCQASEDVSSMCMEMVFIKRRRRRRERSWGTGRALGKKAEN